MSYETTVKRGEFVIKAEDIREIERKGQELNAHIAAVAKGAAETDRQIELLVFNETKQRGRSINISNMRLAHVEACGMYRKPVIHNGGKP